MGQAATAKAAPINPIVEPSAGLEDGKATEELRKVMVERQLRPFDVTDLPVLQRFFDVPREFFLPPELKPIAYSDLAIPGRGTIGAASRAIPAPLVLARFLQKAEIRPTHRVLDVAGGAGRAPAGDREVGVSNRLQVGRQEELAGNVGETLQHRQVRHVERAQLALHHHLAQVLGRLAVLQARGRIDEGFNGRCFGRRCLSHE